MQAPFFAFLLALGLQAPTPQQPAVKPGDKCSIEGTVAKASTGEPLKKAAATLRKAEHYEEVKSVATDANGRFEIKNIDPGRYYLFVTRNGYVRGEYGQRTPDGRGAILALAPGQRLRDITFRLILAAAITGHIYDEDGEPVAEVEVHALRYRYEKGQRKLEPSNSTQTNDLGEYRLYGLPPGQYYVSASYNPAQSGMQATEGGYAPVFYPGTSDPNRAAPVELRAGDEYPAVDINLQPIRTVTIRGRIINAVTGQPGVNADVMLMPGDPAASGFAIEYQTYIQDPQGSFEIHGVRPGSYYLLGAISDEGKRFVTREPLEVGNSDLEGLNIVIGRGIDLRGRVHIEGKGDLDLSSLNVMLWPRDENIVMDIPQTSIKSDATFVIANVPDGIYRIQLWTLPEDYYLKSARLESEDVLESGLAISRKQPSGWLELVLSANGGRIDGIVMKDQQPFSGARVVLVPEPAKRGQERLYKDTTTDQYGRFTLRGLNPGDYKLFAWESIEEGAYRSPDFLRTYEDKGQPTHVDEGSRQSFQLQLIPSTDESSH